MLGDCSVLSNITRITSDLLLAAFVVVGGGVGGGGRGFVYFFLSLFPYLLEWYSAYQALKGGS